MWTFYVGGHEFKFSDINHAKEIANEIRGLADATATDLSKHLNDLCCAIDVDYQVHHGLDEDNWDMVHTD